MNILRIVYDFPPPWYGLAPGPYELSKAQIKIGNEITILAGEWPRKKSYIEGGLKVKRFPCSLRYINGYFTYSPMVLFYYLILSRKFDIIHAHNYHPFWYYIYRKILKDKIPLVLHMHITSAERAYRHKRVPFLTKYFEWRLAIYGEKLGCELSDAIICVSESVKNEVLKWYKPNPEKVFVIPNGVNIELFSPGGANLRKELELENSKVILFVGVLNKRKRVNLIIEALKYLPDDYKLLIIGEGQDKGKLIKLVRNLGMKERVIFIGLIPYLELSKYYRTANIFVLPSTLEGFPKVILEALSCGVPVITSESFKGDEFLSNQIFQINNVTPEKIAEKIQEVINSKYKVNIEEIKNNYDWNVIAERIQKIYLELVK